MNVGFYFAILIGMLLMLSCIRKAPIIKTISGIEVFSKDRIELSRVAAAFLIVLGHSQMKLELYPSYPALLRHLNVGSYWVSVFFILSGYGVIYSVKHKENYLNRFLSNHLIKILIPYASAHVIYYVVKRLTGTVFSAKEIFWGILGKGYIVDFSWYPVVIILLYVLFYVVWRLKLKEYQKVILIVLGNIGITFGLYWVFKGLEWWYFSTMSFSTGIILYYLVHKMKLNSTVLLFSGLLIAIGGDVFMIPVCHRLFGSGVQIIYYILAHNVARTGMAIALITALSSVYRKKSNLIRKLSGISYEIYLMHGLILYLLIGVKTYEMPWMFVLLMFVASIILAKIMHITNQRFIKKFN